MYASIQSLQFKDFYCRVLCEPVKATDQYKVYKLVGHGAEINKNVNGIFVGKFDHVAIDNNSNVYLFDINESKGAGNLGPCDFIPDRQINA